MEKRGVSMGIHKKKIKKHTKKKGLLKKIVDYLKSDYYMFAPLVSSQRSDFPPTNSFPLSPTGVETKIPSEEKDKKLVDKVGEYLKSDSYMFAPLIGPQPSHDLDDNTVTPHSGAVWHLKRVTTAVSTRKVTKKTIQPTEDAVKVIREDKPSENTRLKRSTLVQETLAHREPVKQKVHRSCRTSSVPGKGALGTEARKLVVE